MGGLILIKILVSLFREILRAAREIRSSKWNRTDALVDGSYAPERGSVSYASLSYVYSLNGEEYSGRYETGGWDFYSASDFARRFPEGAKIVIRYQSNQPDQSLFCEADQAVSGPFSGARL